MILDENPVFQRLPMVSPALTRRHHQRLRELYRSAGWPCQDVLEVEHKLMRHVPAEFRHDAHHWLILHGRYTCVARKPRCGSCVIEDLCEYPEKIHD